MIIRSKLSWGGDFVILAPFIVLGYFYATYFLCYRKQAVENNTLTMESIYKILLHFEKVYDRLSGDEQKRLLVDVSCLMSLKMTRMKSLKCMQSVVLNGKI